MSSASTSALAANARLASLYAAMMPSPILRVPVVDVDAIIAVAYREGFAAGTAETELVLTAERQLLAAARAAFAAAMVVDCDALRGVFVTLVGALARTVIAAELRLSPIVMAQLVDTALAAVTSEAEVVVRVHPDDAGYLECAAVTDPTLTRGSVIVEAGSFIIADGFDSRLTALIETLL